MYTLAAGAVNGVSPGSVYAIYRTRDEAALRKAPLELLRVSHVDGTKSTLIPTSAQTSTALSSDQSAYALQYSVGANQSLLLYAMAEDRAFLVQEIARRMQNRDESTRPLDVQFVDLGAADLAVTVNTTGMRIRVLYPPIRVCGLQELPFSTDMTPGDIYNTLSAALHFFWHLKRTSPQQPLQGQVKMKFHRLQEVPADDDFDEPSYEPCGSDLNVSGTVSLHVDADAAYGITLVNSSPFALYPSLFFFSSSDLSISEWF